MVKTVKDLNINGDGTKDCPLEIYNINDLLILKSLEEDNEDLSLNEGGGFYYSLMNDIDLEGNEFFINSFNKESVFDGNDNKIINGVSKRGYIIDILRGTIKNTNFKNFVIRGDGAVGFIGYNIGTISNCKFTKMFIKEYNLPASAYCLLGGIVVKNNGSIKECEICGILEGVEDIGGIVGINDYNGVIKKCTSKCIIPGDYSCGRIGGISALNYSGGVVEECVSDSIISTLLDYDDYNDCNRDHINFIVGYNRGRIINCTNSGFIENGEDEPEDEAIEKIDRKMVIFNDNTLKDNLNKTKKIIFDHVNYIPHENFSIQDETDAYWKIEEVGNVNVKNEDNDRRLNSNGGYKYLRFSYAPEKIDTIESVSLPFFLDKDDNFIYRGQEFTLMCIGSGNRINKTLGLFDNEKELKKGENKNG